MREFDEYLRVSGLCEERTVLFCVWQLRERRCVSAQECWSYAPVSKAPPIFKTLPEGLCVPVCPPGSAEDPNDRHRCVKCPGRCPKGMSGRLLLSK